MHHPKIEPSGKCWCGCGSATESLFAAGHDKRAESMLMKILHGPENRVAAFLSANGYGGDGMNLTEAFQAKEKEALAHWKKSK